MGTLVVRKLLISGAVALAVCMLGGCDSAPSTPIAPDQQLPDTSKMTPEQIQELHRNGSGPTNDRASAPGAPPPVGHGETPTDRQVGG